MTGSPVLEHIRLPSGASKRRGSYSSTSPSAWPHTASVYGANSEVRPHVQAILLPGEAGHWGP